MDTITSRIKLLLENSEEAKESYKNIISLYRFHYSTDTETTDSEIERITRMLKRKFPTLRDSKWQERQKYALKMKDKYRSQEGPEDLSDMFEPLTFKRETVLQYITRKAKELFS